MVLYFLVSLRFQICNRYAQFMKTLWKHTGLRFLILGDHSQIHCKLVKFLHLCASISLKFHCRHQIFFIFGLGPYCISVLNSHWFLIWKVEKYSNNFSTNFLHKQTFALKCFDSRSCHTPYAQQLHCIQLWQDSSKEIRIDSYTHTLDIQPVMFFRDRTSCPHKNYGFMGFEPHKISLKLFTYYVDAYTQQP